MSAVSRNGTTEERATSGGGAPDPVVVAIDGPSGSGKSSVSRETARRLGYGYVDTGAAYRVLAWLSLESDTDRTSPADVIALLDDSGFRPPVDPDRQRIEVGGRDLTTAIREDRVSAAASEIARLTEVREGLNEIFRTAIAGTDRSGVVIEGRDITTVVAPDAPVRILLTADPAIRASRRATELGRSQAEAVAAAMRRRDASDALVVDFLTAADGVVTIDSTELDFEQTVDAVLGVVRHQTRTA